jgi:hypothetical protein
MTAVLLLGNCIIRQPDGGPIFSFGLVPFGMLLIFWAFRSRPIRKLSGFRAKVKAFSSNYGDGPDQSGRVFFAGVGFIVIGAIGLLLCGS